MNAYPFHIAPVLIPSPLIPVGLMRDRLLVNMGF